MQNYGKFSIISVSAPYIFIFTCVRFRVFAGLNQPTLVMLQRRKRLKSSLSETIKPDMMSTQPKLPNTVSGSPNA